MVFSMEVERGDEVKACPICGCVYVSHCWHEDTEEISSEWMSKAKAKELRQSYREEITSGYEMKMEQLEENDEAYSP